MRPDAIVATGRSDHPNQVNNVLGFPYVFRGALDVRARKINMAMKVAAVRALAALAREDVPEQVVRAYGGREFRFVESKNERRRYVETVKEGQLLGLALLALVVPNSDVHIYRWLASDQYRARQRAGRLQPRSYTRTFSPG